MGGQSVSRARPLEDDPESQVDGGAVLGQLRRRDLVGPRTPRTGRADLVLPVEEGAAGDHVAGGARLRWRRTLRISQGIRRTDVGRPDITAPLAYVAGQVEDALR